VSALRLGLHRSGSRRMGVRTCNLRPTKMWINGELVLLADLCKRIPKSCR
jgi:hypothetical protein